MINIILGLGLIAEEGVSVGPYGGGKPAGRRTEVGARRAAAVAVAGHWNAFS